MFFFEEKENIVSKVRSKQNKNKTKQHNTTQTKQNNTKQNKTKQNNTKQNKTNKQTNKQTDKTNKQNKTKQHNTTQHKRTKKKEAFCTRPPSGNQVDGLPLALHTEGYSGKVIRMLSQLVGDFSAERVIIKVDMKNDF